MCQILLACLCWVAIKNHIATDLRRIKKLLISRYFDTMEGHTASPEARGITRNQTLLIESHVSTPQTVAFLR
jgi:hypothetical protein